MKKNMKHITNKLLLVGLCLLIMTGCFSDEGSLLGDVTPNNLLDELKAKEAPIPTAPTEEEKVYVPDYSIINIEDEIYLNEEGLYLIDEIIKAMSLEEKVGQLFIVDLYSLNGDSEPTAISNELIYNIDKFHIGGVIFFGPNITLPGQVTRLITDLQETSNIPLFIAVDEEGGIVRRIGSNVNMGISEVPTASVIGDSNDTGYAYDLAYQLGLEINALGFNMNYAPVADVNTNPDNPIIGERAFSDDPKVVAKMVKAFGQGLQEAGVIAVAKHFPGHGDTSLDTHTGDVYVEHDRARLDKTELVPFKAAVDAGLSGIMVAHIVLEQVTGTTLPATFSPELLKDLLRIEYGYEGLIITDAMTMDAVSERYTDEEAGVKAFLAGNDIILMPNDLETTYYGLLNAFESGELNEATLDEAVRRILEMKLQYNILPTKVIELEE